MSPCDVSMLSYRLIACVRDFRVGVCHASGSKRGGEKSKIHAQNAREPPRRRQQQVASFSPVTKLLRLLLIPSWYLFLNESLLLRAPSMRQTWIIRTRPFPFQLYI